MANLAASNITYNVYMCKREGAGIVKGRKREKEKMTGG